MKQKLTLTALLLIAALIQMHGQNVGEPAPGFEVDLLSGDTFRLDDHEGKVVAIFFFGNTCPSCRAVGPEVESAINQAFGNDSAHFIILGIDTWDSSSNPNSVDGFKKATGITFPLGIKGGDVAAAFKSTYDRLLVIDKAGTLVHKGQIVASNDINNAVAAIEEGLTVTAVEDLNAGTGVKIYPNPASDLIFVGAGDEHVQRIALFDLSGKKVKEKVIPAGFSQSDIEMDLSELQPGVYFYSVRSGVSTGSGKLLIQR